MIRSGLFSWIVATTAVLVATPTCPASAADFLQEANEVFYPDHYVAPNDVDGDGTSDLLWFNDQTHQFAYWISGPTISSSSYSRSSYHTFTVTPGYKIAALGDLTADRRVDLVWTSDRRDLYLWSAAGTGFTTQYIGTYPAGWQLVGAADVNGDTHADLLWMNPGTCEFAYWLMNGARRVGSRTIHVDCAYHIAAIGHFQQSRYVDLLWTSDAHDLVLWEGKGAGFQSKVVGSYGAQEHVIGAAIAGDFGGLNVYTENGSNEFLQYEWRHWFDNQGQQTDSLDFVQSFPINQGDYLAATGNFDGDEAVLVWANDTSNEAVSPSTPGGLSWYTETMSWPGSGWNHQAIGSYPSGWTLVGSQP